MFLKSRLTVKIKTKEKYCKNTKNKKIKKFSLFFLYFFKNNLKNNFYMAKTELPAEKRHYSLPVCNMTCLNLCYFLRYALRQRRLILGRSVESRT